MAELGRWLPGGSLASPGLAALCAHSFLSMWVDEGSDQGFSRSLSLLVACGDMWRVVVMAGLAAFRLTAELERNN
jgi:hypothetical protein